MSFRLNSKTKFSILAGAAWMSLAATPIKDELIELKGFLNARAEAKFRSSDKNKIYRLPPGTKALVREVKHFSTGNYGLCLEVKNAEIDKTKDCYWVYYVPAQNKIELFGTNSDTESGKKILADWQNSPKIPVAHFAGEKLIQPISNPKIAVAAQTRVAVPAVVAPISAPEKVASVYPKHKLEPKPIRRTRVQNADLAVDTVDTIERLNDAVKVAAPQNDPTCPGCNTKRPTTGETCTAKNSYLENEMESLKSDPESVVAKLLDLDSAPKYIKDACFKTSMIGVPAVYKHCDGNKLKKVSRPCATENLVKMTRNAFDLTMDCLGEYLTGDKKTVKAAASQFFFMMKHESGLNVNAFSPTGAGGMSQLTDQLHPKTHKPAGAISMFNRIEKRLMEDFLKNNDEFLKENNDSRCAPVLRVVRQGMGEGPAKSCDRVSLSKGNPLLNMVYGLGVQKQMRATVDAFFINNRLAKGMFENIQPDAREYLLSKLAQWAHNTGGGGMLDALDYYARNHSREAISTIDDADKMLANMRTAVRKTTDGRSAAEPTNYLKNINTGEDNLPRQAGDQSCEI